MSAPDARKWQEIKALFQQAIDLPADAREAFLDRSCRGNAALRTEVESLIASHDDPRPFLETPAVPGAGEALAAGLEDSTERLPALAPGARVAHYEVIERVGAGGMGDVYRARDTTLHRFVALKIVRDPSSAGTGGRALREARAASALNHPHICTIHETGESDGKAYLAMEFVAGRPLSRLIPAEGFPAPDVVRYGMQIADAVAHAHEHGVIHRDLKGSNVVVTPEGQAKVLDFGLAQRLAVGGADSRAASTRAGAIAGTLGCMAPELLRGQSADARSDIWALGVLLYQMASGRRPFSGATPFEVTSAILTDSPLPLPSRVPAPLGSVILRCLARDPDERLQTALEVKAALGDPAITTPTFWPRRDSLRRIALGVAAAAGLLLAWFAIQPWISRPGDPATPRASVAVLPFSILAGAEEVGFLGIGLPDTIVSRLAVIDGVRVRPTSAVLRWERASVDPKDAGRALAVEYVLTGTVQKEGDRIRVSPQLVRVIDGAAIWARQYTLTYADLLGVQDPIAAAVAGALQLQISRADRERLYRRYTQDPEAYRLYLHGRSELARMQAGNTRAAIRSFEAALARDPGYALAHAGIAAASAQMRLFFAKEPEVAKWEARAHESALGAMQLDPSLAESHEALAAVYRSAEFNWDLAIEESARALTLNRNLDRPHLYRASAFSHLGLLDLVPGEVSAAMDINPESNVEAWRVHGVTAMFGGRFDEAVALLEKARGASGSMSADWNLAHAYYYAGRRSDAESMLRGLGGSARSERRGQATLASFLAARQERTGARALIAAVTSASYRDHHVAYALGAAHAQLGLHDEALRWLGEASSTGYPCYPWYARDPLLAPLRSTPGFRRLMDEMKGSWERAAARHRAAQ